MPRARLLKPGFFTNEDLLELPYEARLLFAGLWCLADREGRLEDRPKRIKIELFPGDNVDVDRLMSALNQHGFLHRYEAESQALVHIRSFSKHQKPHPREAASTLPACPCEASMTPQDTPRPSQGRAKDMPRTHLGDGQPGRSRSRSGIGSTSEAEAEDAAPAPFSEKDEVVGRLCRSWENATGTTVTHAIGDSFDTWLEKLPEAAIVKAVAETGANGAKAWKYTEAILRRYETQGWADKPRTAPEPIEFMAPLPKPPGITVPDMGFRE